MLAIARRKGNSSDPFGEFGGIAAASHRSSQFAGGPLALAKDSAVYPGLGAEQGRGSHYLVWGSGSLSHLSDSAVAGLQGDLQEGGPILQQQCQCQ